MAKAAKKAAPAEKETPKKVAKKAVTTEKEAPKKAAKKAATVEDETPTKAATNTPKKAAAKKSDKEGGNAKGGLMAPLTVTPDLAKVVGKDPLPRTEILKKMWDYIKANGLQDKENRRMINADEKLKVVFDGKDQVSMFELAKVINNHIKK